MQVASAQIQAKKSHPEIRRCVEFISHFNFVFTSTLLSRKVTMAITGKFAFSCLSIHILYTIYLHSPQLTFSVLHLMARATRRLQVLMHLERTISGDFYFGLEDKLLMRLVDKPLSLLVGLHLTRLVQARRGALNLSLIFNFVFTPPKVTMEIKCKFFLSYIYIHS